MIKEIKAPSPGESISEVEIARWFVSDGDVVAKDQEIAEIESDKATLPLIAEESGKIKIKKQAGEAVSVGEVLCTIDTSHTGDINPAKTSAGSKSNKESIAIEKQKIKKEDEPVTPSLQANTGIKEQDINKSNLSPLVSESEKKINIPAEDTGKIKITPVAKKMMEENDLSVGDIINGLRKITSHDIKRIILPAEGTSDQETLPDISRNETRKRMSVLRRKLSERLVAVKNETAMLTTFNEADMSRIITLRKKYQEIFIKTHGVKLGFMSFFTKASATALKLFPMINSRIEGEEIITPDYCDIGIAVQSEKGLMVPVLRNAESMSIAGIENEIAVMAEKARTNRLSIEDMKGGTFTISNGGVFGSMLSTPILNPPQAAILGMHNITERPVAKDGQVVIRPVMFLALTYDHRIIDGKDSVGFLVKVKELLENPEKLIFAGTDPERALLNLPG